MAAVGCRDPAPSLARLGLGGLAHGTRAPDVPAVKERRLQEERVMPKPGPPG